MRCCDLSDPGLDPPPVTVSRPGEPSRETDLLVAGPRAPRWSAAIAGAVALLLLAGAGAVSALHDEERERAAADVFDVRVSTGGTGVTYDDEGLLRLTFAVDNRGPGVRLGLPRLRSPAFTLLPGRPPQPVAAGAAALLVVRVRPDCARVVAAPGGLRLQLPVVPPSGREHLVSVTVDEPLMLALARQGCDRR